MKIHPYIYAGVASKVTEEKVIESVCQFYEVDTEQAFSRSRKKKIRKARQVIHYFLSIEVGLSSLKIAKLFNGLDQK